jgi:hypothetical protein
VFAVRAKIFCRQPHVWFSSTLASSPLPGDFAGIVAVDLRSGSRWRFDVWLLWRGGIQSSAAQNRQHGSAAKNCCGKPCRHVQDSRVSLPPTPTGGGEAAVRRLKPQAGWLSSRLREPMARLWIAGLAQSLLTVVACCRVERHAALCEDPKHALGTVAQPRKRT